MAIPITDCNDINAIKESVCKQTNDLQEFLENESTPTTNFNLTPLKKIVSDEIATVNQALDDYVIPTNATYNYDAIDLRVKSLFKRSGYTKEVSRENRWLETNTPNVIVDKVSEPIVIDGVVYDRLGDELIGTYPITLIPLSGGSSEVIGDNRYRISTIASSTGAYISIHNLNVGKTYKYSVFLQEETVSPWVAWIRDTTNNNIKIDISSYDNEGVYSVEFTATTTVASIRFGAGGAGTYIMANPSVRELQSLELPSAPFATGSSDELLDDKVNGLTTQQAHSKGDIVVTGNELWDGNLILQNSNWTDNGDGTYTSNGGIGLIAVAVAGLTLGEDYVAQIEILTYNSGTIYSPYDGSGMIELPSSVGIYNVPFVYDTESKKIYIYSATFNGTIGNISVTLKDKTYRAIADTTAGDLLTNTAKFEAINFCTRQDVFYSTPTGYGSFKGYKDFTATELAEGGSDLIASRYSDRLTKISEGCYLLDGTTKVTNLQVSGARLNAGAYHPMFNKSGVDWFNRVATIYDHWYNIDDYLVTSPYKCFEQSYGRGAYPLTGSRPDSKFYDKIYLKGEGGLASHSLFYAKDDYVLPRDKFGLSSGSGSYLMYPSSSGGNVGLILSGSLYVYTANNIGKYNYNDVKVGDEFILFSESTGAFAVGYYNGGTLASTDLQLTLKQNYGLATGSAIAQDGTYSVIYTKKHPQLLTYAENLTIDLIGSPEFYPSSWKSFLAGGGVSGCIPNLVQDTGVATDLNPSGWFDKVTQKAKWHYVALGYSTVNSNWVSDSPTNDRHVDNKEYLNTLNFLDGDVLFAIMPYTAYNQPMVQLDPQKITKVTHIHEVVYSGDSYDIESNNLILNQVSGIIQTGNNQIVKSLPITAIDNATDLFDYVDDTTNTTPTFIMFDAILNDGAKVQCIWGSSDGVIDKSNVYGRRY